MTIGAALLTGVLVFTVMYKMLTPKPANHPTVAGTISIENPVAPLPGGNLLQNPWFADATCSGPSLDSWTSVPADPDHQWTASNKPTNPSPITGCATASRVSVGEEDGMAATVQPNKDVKLYQIVSANPDNKYLVYDMYWVTHTINYGTVTVYGSDSKDPDGTWTKVWTPFNYSVSRQLVPPTGVDKVTWLWKCYSQHYAECAGAPELPVNTTLSKGYPFYKVELSASLPAKTGGLKTTGMYFGAFASADDVPAPEPAVSISPIPATSPSPRVKPSASPTTSPSVTSVPSPTASASPRTR